MEIVAFVAFWVALWAGYTSGRIHDQLDIEEFKQLKEENEELKKRLQ